jgi:amino acid transporter
VGGQRGHRRRDPTAARGSSRRRSGQGTARARTRRVARGAAAPSSPGAQVLFGFLLAIRFTSPFTDLNTVQRYVYYATLLTTAVALVLLLAPSAYHRLRFREGDKDAMVRKGNREAIARTGAIALAFTGVLYLITDLVFTTQAAIAVAVGLFALTGWRWWAIALYRKAREQAAAKDTSADA